MSKFTKRVSLSDRGLLVCVCVVILLLISLAAYTTYAFASMVG